MLDCNLLIEWFVMVFVRLGFRDLSFSFISDLGLLMLFLVYALVSNARVCLSKNQELVLGILDSFFRHFWIAEPDYLYFRLITRKGRHHKVRSQNPPEEHDHCPWDYRKHHCSVQWKDLWPGRDQARDDWSLPGRVLHLIQAS